MMRKDDYFSRTAGIIERASYEMENQRNVEFVAFPRRCVTKTARQILSQVREDINVSIGSIMKYKPFYIQTATEREMQTCMCKFCLNTRLMFDALRSGLVDEEEKSLSSLNDYFGYGFSCGKYINGAYKRDCIIASCESDACFFKPRWDSTHFKTNLVTYH